MKVMNINHRLSKDYLLNGNNEDNLKLEISLDVDYQSENSRPMHYCVLLDASGSMYYAIRDDEIQKIEGRQAVNIENGSGNAVKGDSTIYLATRSLSTIIDRMSKNDTLTLITYNEEARVIFEKHTKENKAEMLEKIKNIPQLYIQETDKYTNMSNALKLGREILNKYNDYNKKIIFITDGRPSFSIMKNGKPVDTKEDALRESTNIAMNQIAMDFIGLDCIKYTNPKNIENLNLTEQLDFTFLEQLSSKANGNVHLVKDESRYIYELEQIIQKSKNSCIVNADLFLKFSNEISVKDYYMIEPQTKYHGNLKLDGRRIGCLNLNEIDSKKTYKFIFDLNVSKEKINDNTDFNIMALKAKYTLNDGCTQPIETPVSVIKIRIGSDELESQRVNGAIENNYELATIKKYEIKYQNACLRNDNEEVISNISKIIHIYESQGYAEEAINMKEILSKYKVEGKISQSDINKSGHASTTMKKGQRKLRQRPDIRGGIRATSR